MGGLFQNRNYTDGNVNAFYNGTDGNAQAFIDAEAAAGVTLTATQKSAINQLVVDLKAANIYTKFKAIYPIIGGTATAHKFNLINPLDTNAAFRLLFVGGWTHSSTGMLPNGVDAYANTNLTPSTAPLLQDSTHYSFYSRSNTTGNYLIDIGLGGTTGAIQKIYIRWSNPSSNLSWSINSMFEGNGNISNTDGRGYYVFNRVSSTTISVFKNNSKTNASQTSSGPPVHPVYISGYPGIFGYGNKECAFFSIGDGLTDAEVTALNTAVVNYQTTLGRQV